MQWNFAFGNDNTEKWENRNNRKNRTAKIRKVQERIETRKNT